ncbi:MAG: hypothetical protein RLZZ127_1309 [Planctomycetota bacterium]|jgi:two-component system chemotaxis sensor kinase CheA
MASLPEALAGIDRLQSTCDLQDWQAIADLQQAWRGAVDAAEAVGHQEAAAKAQEAIAALDGLFTEDITAALAGAVRDLLRTTADQVRGMLETSPSAEAPAQAPSPAPAAMAPEPVPEPEAQPHPAPGAPDADPVLTAPFTLGPEADPAMLAEFATEATEHLQAIEGHLLTIEGGQDPEAINACFRAFHTLKGLAGFIGLEREKRLAHAAESLLDKVRSGDVPSSHGVMDLLLQSRDVLMALVAASAGAGPGVVLAADPRLAGLVAALHDAAVLRRGAVPTVGEILVGTGKLTRAQLEAALIRQGEDQPDRKLGEILVEDGRVAPQDVQRALETQQAAKQTAGGAAAAATAAPASMRVDVGTVDRLADAIGELVIATNMLFHADELKGIGSRRVAGLLAGLDRVTRQVQGMAQRLRLVSLKPTFQRMTRLVRDLERKTGKKVDLVVEGDDVELDKSVVDRLADPMIHLVRNALDHGLEPEAERIAAGKPPVGRLRLAAERRAGAIHIVIEEDGRGLGRERILRKARERGLIAPDADLSDEEVWELIYLPGFSTAEQVTDLSGRGVGMDVVRRMVSESRGRILTTSRNGHGTTFTLVLPLTLAIIDGMVLSAGGQHYIIPTLSVVLASRLDPAAVTRIQGGRGRLVDLLGRQIPIFSLSHLLGLSADEGPRPLVVVVQDGHREIGLVVDAVIGRQQVVLKTLGRGLPPAPGLSGATITGDGLVCLVLDIHSLVQATTHAGSAALAPA